MEHRRLWLRQEISNGRGSIRTSALADCAVAIPEVGTHGISCEDASLQVVLLIDHDLNGDPNHLIDWPSEFGNGTKASLPELPIGWVTGKASQTLLMVIQRSFLPNLLNPVENPTPLLKVTKDVVAQRLRVLLCDPLITEQALVQPLEASDYRPIREKRGFSHAAC
ncbi:MAG: hypothetical protein M1541_07905 [Acidobacteria bacterium]|nr:hypothetical protein [Acidobacteriota bacterium]